jgi:hypothetical protein
MSAKKLIENEAKTGQSGVKTIREKRIMNAVVNTSIILMGTLMGGFTEIIMNGWLKQ